MRYLIKLLMPAVLVLLVFVSGCRGPEGSGVQRNSNAGDLIKRAKLLSISGNDSCRVISIVNPWQGADNVRFTYYLVRRGTKIPDGVDSSDIIFVPVRKIICMSVTHLAMVAALGEDNAVAGISGRNYIYSENIRKRTEQGLIKDVGYDSGINKELILDMNPDLVVMYGVGSESAGYTGRIRELGVKVAFDAEYLENDPLGRAEWIKFFGALFCRQNMADSIFDSEVKEYESLKKFVVNNITGRPSVMLGLPFQDTWYISPGNSYISRMIYDAGGKYLWDNTRSETAMPFGMENVFLKAMDAVYWLNPGSAESLDEISLVDHRLAELPCYRAGNVYNNNNRITAEGGNDYWESGIVHPHIVLNDIAAILHPEIFNDYHLVYYRKLLHRNHE